MASEISITRCIEALKGGDHDAAQRIWEAYFHRLVGLARGRLRDAPRRAADEEDVALSAFDSFCRGVDAGRFPRLDDRHDLWQVLVLITVRKAIDYRKRWERQGAKGWGIEEIVGREPTPALAAMVADQLHQLLEVLDDDELRQVARWKLDGYTNAEIARMLGRCERAVERMLNLIRRIWKEKLPWIVSMN